MTREQRDKRVDRFLVEQAKAKQAEQDAKHEEYLLKRFTRSTKQEQCLEAQLCHIRKQKEVIINHRLFREQQVQQRREKDSQEAAKRAAVITEQEKMARSEEIKWELDFCKRLDADRDQVIYQEHAESCKQIVDQIVDLATKVGECRFVYGNPVPGKQMKEWKKVLFSGLPLYEPSDVGVQERSMDTDSVEIKKMNILNELDYDEYTALGGSVEEEQCTDDWMSLAVDPHPPEPPPPQPPALDLALLLNVSDECSVSRALHWAYAADGKPDYVYMSQIAQRLSDFNEAWPKLEEWFEAKQKILVRVDANVDEEELFKCVESILLQMRRALPEAAQQREVDTKLLEKTQEKSSVGGNICKKPHSAKKKKGVPSPPPAASPDPPEVKPTDGSMEEYTAALHHEEEGAKMRIALVKGHGLNLVNFVQQNTEQTLCSMEEWTNEHFENEMKSWSPSVSSSDMLLLELPEIVASLKDKQGLVNWRRFVLGCALPWPSPSITQLLDALQQFKARDVENTGHINEEQYLKTLLWFPQETAVAIPEDPSTPLPYNRLSSLFKFFLRMFADHSTSPPCLNYTSMLLYLAADPNPKNGFVRALSVVVGQHLKQMSSTQLVKSMPSLDEVPEFSEVDADFQKISEKSSSNSFLGNQKVSIAALLTVLNHGCSIEDSQSEYAKLVGVYEELGYRPEESISFSILSTHAFIQHLMETSRQHQLVNIYHLLTNGRD
uniref:Uncharacterized protein n=1 Tax=Knipowitschia caucasica TaxID=637954 RepID=A0AAV2MQH4_KNICA